MELPVRTAPFFLTNSNDTTSKFVIKVCNHLFTLNFYITSSSFASFVPTRPEGAEALSPGQRPGLFWAQTCRPVRAKALKLQAIHKAFALTGRLADCYYTQGDALG